MCTRKGTEGSNPSLSASLRQAYGWAGQPSTDHDRGRPWSLLAEPRAKAARHRLGESGHDPHSIGATLIPSRVTLLGLLWGFQLMRVADLSPGPPIARLTPFKRNGVVIPVSQEV